MAKDMNLQDVFLNQARKDRIPVTIYITNGFQFKGIVKGFDSYTVILDTEGRQNLIYKHAISTITPLRPISLLDAFDKEETAEVKEKTDCYDENHLAHHRRFLHTYDCEPAYDTLI